MKKLLMFAAVAAVSWWIYNRFFKKSDALAEHFADIEDRQRIGQIATASGIIARPATNFQEYTGQLGLAGSIVAPGVAGGPVSLDVGDWYGRNLIRLN